MKTILLPLLLLFLVGMAVAQKSPFKYGSISLSDLKMTQYDPDTTAEAVYFFRHATAAVTWATAGRHLQLNFKLHSRLKILKTNGLHYATISIPIQGTRVTSDQIVVKGATFNLEGGKVVETPVTQEGKFVEDVVRGLHEFKITFPNVKVGSVLELNLSLASGQSVFTGWTFQERIPVLHAEYWAITPEDIQFDKYMQGYVPVTKYEAKDLAGEFGSDVIGYHWIIKDVPAFQAEPYMQAEENFLSRVNFTVRAIAVRFGGSQTLQGSWEEIAKRLATSHDFGMVIPANFFVQDKTRDLINGLDDPLAKIEAIHKYVRENIKWDKRTTYFPHENLKKIWDDQKGTSADINFLFASMLDKAGLAPRMVVLRKKTSGIIRKEYPTANQFNYVICTVNVNGTPVYLDATEKYLPPDLIPERALAEEGLLVSDVTPVWVPIKSGRKSYEQVAAEMSPDGTGQMIGKVNFTFDGYDAYEMRSGNHESTEEDWRKKLESEHHWRPVKTEMKNLEDLGKPSGINFDVTYATEPWEHDVVYLNPYVALRMGNNPFKAEQRIYPVDMGHSFDQKYYIKITIPDGYTIEELPKSTIMKLPDNSARFIYNTNVSNQIITVTSTFNIAKNTFSQAEYPHLREFYNQVVAKQAEMIVLKRK